jgi:hypothetical protein
MNWQALGMALVVIALIFQAVFIFKNNRGLFTKTNFGKTAETMGVLALLLIAFVGILVWLLKH